MLFFIAAFRVENIDRDYGTYVSAFYEDNVLTSIFEPTFLFFSFFIKTFLYEKVIFLFIFYAIIGVLLKLYSIFRISDFPLFSLLLYFSYFFTLQEMTQIRIGAALSIFFFSLPYLLKRDYKFFFLFVSISFCFHFSTIILAPLVFLNSQKINKSHWLIFLVLSILVTFFSNAFLINFFETFDFIFFQNKINAYAGNNNAELNIFNFWIILRISFSLLLLFKIDYLFKYNKYSILLLKIYFLSICFYYIFSYNPVFASRINDILGIVEILLFPSILYIIKPKYIAKSLLIVYSAFFLYLNLFHIGIFTI
jgi:hypothetical protein